VEGFEAAVLRGMDFGHWRPWVLLIEATRPLTPTAAYEEWQPLVLGAGYRLAYFDGVNQFYVAQEHEELIAALRTPPNFFDGFQLRAGHHYSHPTAELEAGVHEARAAADIARQAAETARVNAEAAARAAANAEQRAAATHQRMLQLNQEY